MEWLLISSPRGLERHAVREFQGLLRDCGYSPQELEFSKERISIIGLSLIRVNGSALEIIQKLRTLAEEDPWGFRLVLKIKPIQRLVETDFSTIVRITNELAPGIPKDNTFRIKLERRLTSIDRDELIFELAKNIDRKVDLDSPDWIVLVDILDKVTGVAVIPSAGILSLSMIRRGK